MISSLRKVCTDHRTRRTRTSPHLLLSASSRIRTQTAQIRMEEVVPSDPLVPAVKAEASSRLAAANFPENNGEVASDLIVKELMCPICMQIMKDAFLTACGHSFCYMCIITHLQNKSDCPCCAQFLTSNQLFPNFVLNKMLKKASRLQISRNASPVDTFRQALQQGCEVSVKELDALLSLLAEKKRKMEQEEAERNMQVLLDFLNCIKKQKMEELLEVQTDLQFIKEDINVVERHRMDLYRARDRYSVKLRMLGNDSMMEKAWKTSNKKSSGTLSSFCNPLGRNATMNSDAKSERKAQGSSPGLQQKDSSCGSDLQHTSQAGQAVLRKKRVHAQFDDLQECYLQKRRLCGNQVINQDQKSDSMLRREGYSVGLENFQSVLTTFTNYSRLRVIAELRHGDLFQSANIVSSIEFDRDDEFFATAGVSKRIKVFDFASVLNEPDDAHFPAVEMSTRSKLSCLSWNKFTKNQIASSDYDGIVTIWDVNTRQSVMEYEEHEKRAWSVDFSLTEPTQLVSGSDDCKVKVWCTNQEDSVMSIDMKAQICCVKYNPGSSFNIAVGSADRHIYYYDLRNISQPLHIFSGHNKAVSYVKFLSNSELASASTDGTLRLWDVNQNTQVRTFRGHTNEKNFVGLAVNSEYLACGSETNEVFIYHKEICKPATWHKFGSPDVDEAEDDAGSYFISAVCWKSDSPTVLTANSQGTIKVLVLAA